MSNSPMSKWDTTWQVLLVSPSSGSALISTSRFPGCRCREALLAFFDFPAEHWDHLRTSNPIESVFATVRHRTVRTKGALSAEWSLRGALHLLRRPPNQTGAPFCLCYIGGDGKLNASGD
jgi:hypothetical protein